MSIAPPFPVFGTGRASYGRMLMLDSGLAVCGALFVTGIIFVFGLYPRIPDISIVYLLVVLPLASARGRYASVLASLVAFLSFDFFIEPPLYTFVIYRVEEWIALLVFLVTALLTSHLAVTLRRRMEEARKSAQETSMLYRLVRVADSEDRSEAQLHALAQTVVDVFAPWGVVDCAILQEDEAKVLRVQASAVQSLAQLHYSAEEQAVALWVMQNGQAVELDEEHKMMGAATLFRREASDARGERERRLVRLVPLQAGSQCIGVLRLSIVGGQWLSHSGNALWGRSVMLGDWKPFFNILLEQVASLVERVRLRSDHLRIELLQRTDELRAALLTSVSHDLRTPLTAIKASATSLLQEDVEWDDEARQSFARSIVCEADRLNRLVGNLLDMSRIEGGALKPEKEWYPLTVLVRDVIARMQPQLRDRPVELSLPDDLTIAELDYVQIDQVLTNLLENALRYTPSGSPIEVSVQSTQQNVLLRVADRGPGIPAAELEHVFDKFYRVLGRQPQRGYPPGSGLGLAICKGIVEAHGGRIRAERRAGGGVCFCVSLPVGEEERTFAHPSDEERYREGSLA